MRYGSQLSTGDDDPPSPKKEKFIAAKMQSDFGFLNSMASLASEILNNADFLHLPDKEPEEDNFED